MINELIEAPDLCVSVEDMKAYLRLVADTDDDLIEESISTATQALERYLNRKIGSQTWKTSYEAVDKNSTVMLPFDPVISIDEVLGEEESEIEYTKILDLPIKLLIETDGAVYVTATYGYSTIPQLLLDGVKMCCAELYEKRHLADLGPILKQFTRQRVVLL